MQDNSFNSLAQILYIEDNRLNMRLVRKNINHVGYSLLEANDAETGIAIALQKTPDVILMDLHLPGMSGLDAIKLIKRHPRLKQIPIIVLTADNMKSTQDDCMNAGCEVYLTKPIRNTHLIQILTRFINPTSESTAITS